MYVGLGTKVFDRDTIYSVTTVLLNEIKFMIPNKGKKYLKIIHPMYNVNAISLLLHFTTTTPSILLHSNTKL